MSVTQRVTRGLRAIGPAVGALLEDLTLVGGGALVAYGTWLYSRPAGFIAAGVLLITGVILKARGAV